MFLLSPMSGSLHLVEVSEGALVPVRDLRLSGDVCWCRWRQGFIVADQEHSRLRYIETAADASATGWRMPEKVRAEHLAIVGDRFFVAGFRTGPTADGEPGPCLMHRVILGDSEWSDAYPGEIGARHSIDALLADDGRLLALDDVITPKYLFVFDEAAVRPEDSRIVTLPMHGPWEKVIGGALTDTHVAVVASTAFMGGSARHLYLLDRVAFKQTKCVSIHALDLVPGWDASGADASVEALYHSDCVASMGDWLVLACGGHGIVVMRTDRMPVDLSVDLGEPARLPEGLADHLSLEVLQSGDPIGVPQRVERIIPVEDAGVVAVVRLPDDSLHSLLIDDVRLHSVMQ